MIPTVPADVLEKARAVWNETIEKHGREIVLTSLDATLNKSVKAFCKRPKIMGLFDRSQASYDQERYMVLLRADDFAVGITPEKFMRATWNQEDHVFQSVTEVELQGVIFGYRVMVKG